MRGAAIIVLGILTSLVLGGWAAGVASPAAEPSPILVPLGHVGATVTYARHERAHSEAAWREAASTSFEVNGTGDALGETGELREALIVRWLDEGDAPPAVVRLDLESRSVLTRETWSRDRVKTIEVHNPFKRFDRFRVESEYGPALAPQRGEATDTMLFWLHGRTLSPGQNLTKDFQRAFKDLWGLGGESRLHDFEALAAHSGFFEEAPTVELRFSGRARFGPGAPSGLGPIAFLGAHVEPGVDVHFVRTLWYNASSAYPIWIQDEVSAAGTQTHVLFSLVSATPSSIVIPFRGQGPTQAEAPAGPSARLGDKPYPTQGEAGHACLGMDEAMRRVESEPQYAPFHAWRAARAQVLLVGIFSLCEPGQLRWDFTYATPAGDGYGVVVRQGQARTTNHIMEDLGGPMKTNPFDPAGLRAPFTTLSDAYAKWDAFAQNQDLTSDFKYLEWGFWFSLAHLQGGPEHWESVRFYRWLQPAENDPSGVAVWLNVDARSGLIFTSTDSRYSSYNVAPVLDEPVIKSRPQAVGSGAAAGPTGLGPADLVSAGLVSGGLLALWLAAYFFPLLKYGGTQAFTVIAGYAKLRKQHLLDHRLREELVNVIRDDPGVSATQISRRVHAGWSTIVYHLRVLEKSGLVTSLIDTRHRRFFPVGEVPHGDRGRIAVLQNERTRRILELVEREPGQHQGSLARLLGISLPGATWHLRRLEQHRLIRRVKVGRTVRIYPNAASAGGTHGPQATLAMDAN